MKDWIKVGQLEDIPKLGSRTVNTNNGDVAIFRNSKDKVFALYDKCPHQGGPLSQGIVHDNSVTCPLHNWVIGLDDGKAKGPDEGCVNTVEVMLEGAVVYIRLDAQTSV